MSTVICKFLPRPMRECCNIYHIYTVYTKYILSIYLVYILILVFANSETCGVHWDSYGHVPKMYRQLKFGPEKWGMWSTGERDP